MQIVPCGVGADLCLEIAAEPRAFVGLSPPKVNGRTVGREKKAASWSRMGVADVTYKTDSEHETDVSGVPDVTDDVIDETHDVAHDPGVVTDVTDVAVVTHDTVVTDEADVSDEMDNGCTRHNRSTECNDG